MRPTRRNAALAACSKGRSGPRARLPGSRFVACSDNGVTTLRFASARTSIRATRGPFKARLAPCGSTEHPARRGSSSAGVAPGVGKVLGLLTSYWGGRSQSRERAPGALASSLSATCQHGSVVWRGSRAPTEPPTGRSARLPRSRARRWKPAAGRELPALNTETGRTREARSGNRGIWDRDG
jgi:hypothetical protein